MRSEFEQQLTHIYPDLFGKYGASAACGDGWNKILVDLITKISAEVRKFRIDNPGHDWWPQISSIKEKYGSLRVYMTTTTSEIEDLIDLAELASMNTCEECGDPGEEREDRGWIYISCDKHKRG